MKRTRSLLVYLSALLVFAGPGLAQADKKQYSEVSIGALTCPMARMVCCTGSVRSLSLRNSN